ncbi:hypothetical protein ACOSP7_009285 [Xanthoceras sorbifolium]
MLGRRVRNLVKFHDIIMQSSTRNFVGIINLKHPYGMYSTGSISTELPRKLKKDERKPLVTAKIVAIYSSSYCGEVHVGHLSIHRITPEHAMLLVGSPETASKERGWKIGDLEHEELFLIMSSSKWIGFRQLLNCPSNQAGVDIPEYTVGADSE